MGTPTKAADNIYCIARKSAAECNDQLNSREGASALTGIERTRLARIELGLITPYPDEVRLMAEVYNAPELMPCYCSHDCQIGKCMGILLPSDQPASLEQLAIRAAIAFRNTEKIRDSLLDITEDGVIDESERDQLDHIMHQLSAISQIAYQLQAYALKIKGGGNDAGT